MSKPFCFSIIDCATRERFARKDCNVEKSPQNGNNLPTPEVKRSLRCPFSTFTGYVKRKAPCWGLSFSPFSFQRDKLFPRCGRPFSSGGGGRAAARPGPPAPPTPPPPGRPEGRRGREGHPSPFDNNIEGRRASTRGHKAKRAAVLPPSQGSSGTFDENMLEPRTEIKHGET